jgi:hypothetical protein
VIVWTYSSAPATRSELRRPVGNAGGDRGGVGAPPPSRRAEAAWEALRQQVGRQEVPRQQKAPLPVDEGLQPALFTL